jgi:quinol monooxygenase YgiN
MDTGSREARRGVPFFVAVYQEVSADRLEEVLATMRGDFATSRRMHPGRRSTRVFQRLNYPTHLLALGEWDSRADYDRLRQTDAYQQVTERAEPPASIEYLTRLRHFARLAVPPAIVGCVTITAPRENAGALEAFVLDEARHVVEGAPGLVAHEVYRVGENGGRLLAVHGWRSIEDLERFRAGERQGLERRLGELGASTDRLTGVVAVQYSRLDS